MLYEKSGIEHKGGPSVQAYVACPGCGEREFVMVMGPKWRFTRCCACGHAASYQCKADKIVREIPGTDHWDG